MSIPLRAVLYFIFLLYLFLGIAIIADIFMSAIETITSRKRKIRYPDPQNKDKYIAVEVRLWNDTVANLTLMALGSSSPEILLSIIEIIGNRFEAGELGPGTSKRSPHARDFRFDSRTSKANISPNTPIGMKVMVFSIDACSSCALPGDEEISADCRGNAPLVGSAELLMRLLLLV